MNDTLQKSYSRTSPYYAKIKDRYLLSSAGSTKKTYHITLDLSGSGIIYEPGDAIGILPKNPPHLVKEVMHSLDLSPNSEVRDPKNDQILKLEEYLSTHVNFGKVSPKLFKRLGVEKTAEHDVPSLLCSHKPRLLDQELPSLLLPMLPRFYSVASSMQHVKDEVDLLVATFEFEMQNEKRTGIASEYLRMHNDAVPIYVLKANHFRLPKSIDTPLIMIGPGTGVAPYRAFMQERIARRSKAKHWLFFGERNRVHDYYYQDYWEKISQNPSFRINAAFSRDQKEKEYVQHHLLTHGKEIWEWIESGAVIYLCGDAKSMAKDVTATLEKIIESYGGLEGKETLKSLRKEMRFQSDVY